MTLLTTGREIIKSIARFVRGMRCINYYFSTVTLADAVLALFFAACVLLRLSNGRHWRDTLARTVRDKFGPRDIYFYGSARSALYHYLRSLNLAPGSEVILTGFTCDVVPNAVIQAGLKPVYADIDPANFCTSPESVRRTIGPNTKVLIVQHTFGIPADIEAFTQIAREHCLCLVEDCAVALGSRWMGRPMGTFGDAAIFSFELSKTITSCRGGMLFVNTDVFGARALQRSAYEAVPEQSVVESAAVLIQLGLSGILYRPVIFNIGRFVCAVLFKFGIFKRSTPDEELNAGISGSYLRRLSGYQARFLVRQLNRLDRICDASRKAARYYDEALRATNGVTTCPTAVGDEVCCIRYPILVQRRASIADVLLRDGVEPGLWFSAPISSPSVNAALFGYEAGRCPTAEDVACRVLNLPTNVRLRESDLERIVGLCRSVDNGISS